MIYRNDNIIEDDESVKGTIGDLKEYFRYQIASQCMKFDFDYQVISLAGSLRGLEVRKTMK